jgi:hypothetical protein
MPLNLKQRGKNLLAKLRMYSVTPMTANVAGVSAPITLLATMQSIGSGFAAPDVPRGLTITGTMAGGTLTGNVVVYGYDAVGGPINETFALNGSATVIGVKAFASVYGVSLPVRITAGDTVKIGYSDLLGFPELVPGNTVLFATFDGVYEVTRPAVLFSLTNPANCTFDLATSLLTGKEVIVYYVAL